MTDYPKIQPTTDFELFVSLALTGGSGTGKTLSGLLLADGLAGGGPFAVVDTENKRALHYKADFPNMTHYNFGPGEAGFPPERWIELLEQIAETDARAVVIDSFSHSWEGINGVLELQAHDLERRGGQVKHNQLAWAAIKPRYRRLLEKIIQAPFHVILCHRGKQVMQENGRNARDTKLRRRDIPWDVSGDKDLIFEMTASILFVPEKPGEPLLLKCPDQFRGALNASARVNRDAGAYLAKWAAAGGIDRNAQDLLDRADKAARKGKGALNTFWAGLTDDERPIAKTKLDGLRQIACEAEAGKAGEDLFEGGAESEPEPPEEALAIRVDRALQGCIDGGMVDDVVKLFAEELKNVSDESLSLEVESMIATRRKAL